MEGGPYVALKAEEIGDWDAFHTVCQRALGFPSDYGRTMTAWIELMSSLRSGDGRVGVQLPPGEMLELEVVGVRLLRERVPDLVEALVDATAVVNRRFIEDGEAPTIALIFS
jgi:hypothetical protein